LTSRTYSTVFVFCLVARALCASDPLYESAERKLELIESGQAKPGSVITFTSAEINAWVKVGVPEAVPEGIRDPLVELGSGSASAYALIDFLKMRQGKGAATNWLVSKLIEGERPVKVSVRLRSNAGRCTVDLTGVEISNVGVSAGVLDFLIKTFFVPLYPNAKIGEPFELGDNIDRIELSPAEVKVTMKRAVIP
jgi:hypothetical protein